MKKVFIKLGLSVGLAGCDREDIHEVEYDQWFAMSVEEQQKYIDEALQEFLHSKCEAYLIDIKVE